MAAPQNDTLCGCSACLLDNPFMRLAIGIAAGSSLTNLIGKFDQDDTHRVRDYADGCIEGGLYREQILPLAERRLRQLTRPKPTATTGRNDFEQVKHGVPVEDLASQFTDLVPAGAGKLKGRCPLHQERTPSFYVFQDSRRWHCFGACAMGGNVITLARELMDRGKL